MPANCQVCEKPIEYRNEEIYLSQRYRKEKNILGPGIMGPLPMAHFHCIEAQYLDPAQQAQWAVLVTAANREDWSELDVDMDGDSKGAPAYHPRALLSVWVYGFKGGVRWCRKLETACRDQIP